MPKEFSMRDIFDNAEKARAERIEPEYRNVEATFTISFDVPTSKLINENNTKFLLLTATNLLNKSAEERHEAVWEDGTPIFERIEFENKVQTYKYQ